MKKFLLAASVLAFSVSALADGVKLPKGTVGASTFTDLVSYEVVTLVPDHPAIPEKASIVNVTVRLKGCADEVGPVTYDFGYAPGPNDAQRLVVYVYATNLHSKYSVNAKCIPPLKVLQIPLPYGYFGSSKEDVGVVLLPSTATEETVKLSTKKDLSLYSITSASYDVVIEPQISIPEVPAEIVSKLRVLLPLNGCMDRLGPVTYTIERTKTGKTTVYLGATSVATKASQSAKCPSPSVTVEIPLGFGLFTKDNVELRLLTDSI